MFSGEIPFGKMNDTKFITEILKHKRPTRPDPSNDLCRMRGLNDDIWELINLCWSSPSSSRPSAGQIVEHLQTLPNQPIDKRPLDNFPVSLSPQILISQPDHPFSDIAASMDLISDLWR